MCYSQMTFNRHKHTFVHYDKYIFDLVKASVAARHFFLNNQTRFSHKLIEYIKKIPLQDDMKGADQELLTELVGICLPEYWE